VPAERYQPSPRAFEPRPAAFEYGPDDQLRKVCTAGRISVQGQPRRIGKALRGKTVALRPTTRDGLLEVIFRTTRITTIDLREPVSP